MALPSSRSPSPPPEPPRVYREGLPFPEAIVIRDQPGPSRRPLSSSLATHAPDHVGLGASRGNAPPKWDSYSAWREWNINTVKHGPPELVNPPTFVPSTTEYDELGRSALHGVEVDVSAGKPLREGLEDGGKVADWYRALSNAGSRSSTPGPSKSKPPDPPPPSSDIDTTSADTTPTFDETSLEPSSTTLTAPTESSAPADTESIPNPRPILKVHRREWFIRRALLTSSQRNSSPKAAAVKPASIGSLLNIPSQPKVVQAQYVLGPENKGYTLLRDRLGWEGGGLGRAPDRIPPLPLSSSSGVAEGSASRSAKRAFEVDENGVVDLTGESSDEEPRVGGDEEEEVEVPGPGGPGRTAPIATTLKLDRLGLGHRRAAPRDHLESTKKKVTHTAAEILEAQRRSRMKPVAGVTLGKKGKIRWKERDKKEREERRRLAAALNA